MSVANDPRFAAVERDYSALKAQLTAGQMTREQFEAALQKLMVQDDSGRYWMMGAESGKWYVYDNQRWVQSDPPAAFAPTPPAQTPAEPTTASRSDALTMASFTPPKADTGAQPLSGETTPASSEPSGPDAAMTMPSFTPPKDTTPPPTEEDRNAARTMPSFTPPKVPQPSEADRNAAMTMPSFTPPQTPIDKAVTMPSFTPPKVTAAPPSGTTAGTKPAEPKPARSMSPILVVGCLLVGLCIIGLAAVVLVASGRLGGNSAVPTIPQATAVLTSVALATATQIAAPTAIAATATSAPTTVPIVVPTTAPTRAPTTTSIPTSAPQATATSIPPTATATNTAIPPTNTPQPTATNTSPPPRTPTPSVEFPVSFNYVGYAKWGNPDPNNCTTSANDKQPRLQFKWEIIVNNVTAKAITDAEWALPTAINNQGESVFVCMYSKPTIPSGQSGRVAVAAYVLLNQYVARISQKVRNTTYTRCLGADGKEIPC